MRKINQLIFRAIVASMAWGTIMLGGSAVCHAAGNTYGTAREALYGENFKSVFNEKLAGSPIEGETPDGVDTANGHLILSRTDLYLDGTGGMDFELGRYYDSNEAIIGNPTVQAVDVLPVDTVYVYCTTHDGEQKRLLVNTAILNNHKKALKDMMVSYEVGDHKREDETEPDTERTKILSSEDFNVYGLASGWKFDLPWIETITITEDSKDQWSARPAYLHFGSRGTIEIETEVDHGGKCYPIKGLAGYSYTDIRLEDWKEEVEGIQCRYLLRDKTGMRTYFNEDGVVVLQKDAHGNKIAFSYTDKIYLKKVTDSVGRVVDFHYEEGEAMKHLASVTVEGKAASGVNAKGGVAKKTIKYTYEERTYTPHNSDTINGLVLKSATVDGSKETYGYPLWSV